MSGLLQLDLTMGKRHRRMKEKERERERAPDPAFLRINFLYQAAFVMGGASDNPQAATLSRYYAHLSRAVAKRKVLRLDPAVQRTICFYCSTVQIAGKTSQIRLREVSASEGVRVEAICLFCRTLRANESPSSSSSCILHLHLHLHLSSSSSSSSCRLILEPNRKESNITYYHRLSENNVSESRLFKSFVSLDTWSLSFYCIGAYHRISVTYGTYSDIDSGGVEYINLSLAFNDVTT
eukprot:g52380.t1